MYCLWISAAINFSLAMATPAMTMTARETASTAASAVLTKARAKRHEIAMMTRICMLTELECSESKLKKYLPFMF